VTNLPAHARTFLFTDVEGSTRLWERFPAAMRASLARHDRIVREAIERHRGRVFKTAGDAFAAVFAAPGDAVAAALDAQRALAAAPWEVEGGLRVRMALHTGAAEERGGDYFGATVNRLARILHAGHGAQTLLSGVTGELVRDRLPEGASLRDLGEHRLRDLAQPERLYQLLHPDVSAAVPPLRTLDATPNNLPLQLTSFIGRLGAIQELRRAIGASRLTTLTGAAGTGKTRLALQVASEVLDDFPDGVWLLELAPLTDAGHVTQAIAAVLGVREEPGRPLAETLADAVRTRRLLLILDNCEHLIGACAEITRALLQTAAEVRILVTSREALGIVGEVTWPVPPMALPDPDRLWTLDAHAALEALLESEAVRLFVERAQSVVPAFALSTDNAEAIANICRRLDGIPLAIELAASRVRVLSVDQIRHRLDDRFRLLTGGSRTALPRHQTLQAALDWSYDLLDEAERAVLRRLSVFTGGFSLESAEAIASGGGVRAEDVLDLLTRLVDKSIVLRDERAHAARFRMLEDERAHAARFRMLETVRQYGLRKLLDAGEATDCRRAHRDWMLAFAERVAGLLRGREGALWLEALEVDHENLRTALRWSLDEHDGAAALRLCAALWYFWHVRGHLAEGRAWIADALNEPESADERVRARALHGGGTLAWRQGDYGPAERLLRESIEILRRVDDPEPLVGSLNMLGVVAWRRGEFAQAEALYGESLALARASGDKPGAALALRGVAEIAATHRQDYDRARALYEESLTLGRESGDLLSVGHSLNGLGLTGYRRGALDAARVYLEEGLAVFRQIANTTGIAYALSNLAMAAVHRGDLEAAKPLLDESAAILKDLGDRSGLAAISRNAGLLRARLGDVPGAARWLARSLELSTASEDRLGPALCAERVAEVAHRAGLDEAAVRLYAFASAARERQGMPLSPLERAERDALLSASRESLGNAAFEASWAYGAAAKPERALQEARVTVERLVDPA
jgi:predicted ATPase/class 3 adenylate cyclase